MQKFSIGPKRLIYAIRHAYRKVFSRLYVVMCTSHNRLVPKEFQEWFDGTKSLLIHGHSFESILRGSREADIGSSSSAPNLDKYIMDTFFGRFFDTVVRMSLRLMVTCNEHIGLAPEKAMKGDLVCVLFDCSVPVLLRQPEHEDTFTFIRECFLDGFMDGAALEQRDFLEMVFCIE
ncbi:hypothetical protein F4823DRAFT_573607 [Ustulina deusta]|nr:hypothetical protein F4823DRAFT_573607 [Ustulina deusta]